VSAGLQPFQRFLDEHRDAVWRLLVSMVGPSEADDCFQETFIAALRAYPRLRPESNGRAWVLTIAQRKALDAHRARRRRALPVADVAGVADVASMADVEAADPKRQQPPAGSRDEPLWDAVAQLPERQRSAVVLRYVGDLAHAEIAQAIGCSEEAARQSLHEGLKRLRKVAQA
jgi:RNA polymerase sigma factor (sigma-70 family)